MRFSLSESSKILQTSMRKQIVRDFRIPNLFNSRRDFTASCVKCGQCLNYKKVDNHYVISKYRTLHIHDDFESRLRVQKQLIKEQSKLSQTIILAEPKMSEPIVEKSGEDFFSFEKLPIITNLLPKIQKQRKFQDLVSELSQNKYEINIDKYYPEMEEKINERSEFLLLASPQMKKKYKKYGRCLFVCTIQDLCQEKPNFPRDKQIEQYNKIHSNLIKKMERKYRLVAFFGLNNFRKIVIFGFGIVLDESQETMSKIFKNFFQFNDCTQTETIITDRGQGIRKAISQYHFQHLLDPGYLLRRFKPAIRDLLHEVIRAQTNEEYNQSINLLQDMLSSDEVKEFEEFKQKSHLFCFSQIPRTFTHMIQYSPSLFQKLRNLIEESNIKHANTYLVFVEQLCSIFQQVNTDSEEGMVFEFPIEKLQGYYFLKQARENLPNVVMKQILSQVERSQKCITITDRAPFSYTMLKRQSKEKETVFVENGSDLKCTCSYRSKRLLPCDHIIRIAIKRGVEVYQLIDDFYKKHLENLDGFKTKLTVPIRNSVTSESWPQ